MEKPLAGLAKNMHDRQPRAVKISSQPPMCVSKMLAS